MNQSTPYSVPNEPGRWRAITLAAVVHVALFAFLWFGIRWQNDKPLTVEAEIWSPNTQEAAPLAAQKMPEPQPQPPIEKPIEKVPEKPLPVPEPRPVATPQESKPDIALEQEKKRKARQKEQEQLAQLRHEKELLKEKEAQKEKEALKQQEALKEKEAQKEKELLKQKDALKEQEAQKKKEAQKEAALAEKAKALAQKKLAAAEEARKLAVAQEKQRKQELEKKAALAAENSQLAKLHEENLRRLSGDTSGSGGSGTAARSQGNRGDPGYAERIRVKVKSNTIFNVPGDLGGNPEAVYELSLLPDGTISGLELKQASGVPGFDEAVERGIRKSAPFSKDKSGHVPRSIRLTYKPKD